jgi:hypothetical protein
MNNTKLQDFVTQTATRGQITFGDVRRLQRDCLPGGIDAGEEAEILIGLDAKVARADKAWSQWLAAAVADFALRSDMTEDGAADWLRRLMAATGQWATVGRRIVRELGDAKRRSGGACLPAEDTGTPAETPASVVLAADTGAHQKPVQPPRPRRKPIKFTSHMKSTSRRTGKSRQRPKRGAKTMTIPAPLAWSSGMAWKHICFQLAAPCA